MRMAVKALTVASAAIWIFFVAFSVTLAYSASAIRVEVSEVRLRLDAERTMLFLEFQILINNSGLYDLSNMEIKITLYDWCDSLLAENVTLAETIPRGSKSLLTPSLVANLSDRFESIVGSNNPLILRYEMKMNYAGVLPVRIYGSTEIMLQGGEA